MKADIKVTGMHCRSCEILIADALLEAEGVKKVEASHAKGSVAVEFDEKMIDIVWIKKIIKEQGYEAK